LKTKILIGILIFFSPLNYIYSKELPENYLSELRILLFNSTQNEESLDSLLVFISALSRKTGINKNPLLLAYKGTGNALLAKYSFFPWNKLSHLNDGLQLLDDAVRLDSSSLEIRFLRFSVLSNIPSFLGYSAEADKEANVIYAMLKSSNYNEDAELIKNAVQFLIASGRLDKNKEKDLTHTYNMALEQ
jgi:hypothetical protein